MTRDWILRVLNGLPVWLWPVFLWDCVVMRRVLDAMFEAGAARITFGVTAGGRIVIARRFDFETPDEAGRACALPRASWERLDPDRIAAAIASFGTADRRRTVAGLPADGPPGPQTGAAPGFLDSG